jgi:hypothetical protein
MPDENVPVEDHTDDHTGKPKKWRKSTLDLHPLFSGDRSTYRQDFAWRRDIPKANADGL